MSAVGACRHIPFHIGFQKLDSGYFIVLLPAKFFSVPVKRSLYLQSPAVHSHIIPAVLVRSLIHFGIHKHGKSSAGSVFFRLHIHCQIPLFQTFPAEFHAFIKRLGSILRQLFVRALPCKIGIPFLFKIRLFCLHFPPYLPFFVVLTLYVSHIHPLHLFLFRSFLFLLPLPLSVGEQTAASATR